MNALEAAVATAPLFKSMLMGDNMLAITDREKYLLYIPGEKMVMPDITGLPIRPDDSLNIPLKEGVMKSEIVPAHVFGFPFNSIVAPIKDTDGQVLGAIGIAFSLEKKAMISDSLGQMVNTLLQTSENVSSTSEEIAATATSVANVFSDINRSSQKVADSVSKTDDILHFVSDVASNSNLLGLNAAIEAARAGEQGKGFAVVANEIRKMADNSSSSVKNIKTMLSDIQSEVQETLQQVSLSSGLAEQQAAATEEIAAAMQTVTDQVYELNRLIEEL